MTSSTTRLVILLFLLPLVTRGITLCIPTAPCTQCNFMSIVRDVSDCQLYHYCYFGRVAATWSCGYNQVYSAYNYACVPMIYGSQPHGDCRRNIQAYVTQPPPLLTSGRSSVTSPQATFVKNNRKGTKAPYRVLSSQPTTTTTRSPRDVFQTNTFKQKAQAKCGIKVSTYIIGGHIADRAEWAWQVSLQAYDVTTSRFRHVCGGTIIHESWVITAAHCVYNSKTRMNFIVVAGLYRLRSEDPWRQIRGVDKTVVHYRYRHRGNYPNDIALIRLSTPLNLTTAVRPACLPDNFGFPERSASPSSSVNDDGVTGAVGHSNIDHNTAKCWTTGYGKGENHEVLKEVGVRFLEMSKCRKLWPGYIKPFHLCAMSNNGTACRGDSGGPLVCASNGRYFLQGVVSWGEGTCDVINPLPTIYTRVADYMDWIRYYMDKYTRVDHG